MSKVPRSNAEWQLWGDVDPLWGVVSWPGRRVGEGSAWTENEFFAVGASDWSDFLRRWEHYGVTLGRCVEIGCGAGRMTRALAGSFDQVYAVDVADGMLTKAKDAVAGRPVTLCRSDGLTLPLADSSVDAAFSVCVFQHLDSPHDVDANWREVARVLRPGGTLLVSLPVHIWPRRLRWLESVHAAQRRLARLKAAAGRWRMGRTRQPIMRFQSYQWGALEEQLLSLGLVDVELTVFRQTSSYGSTPCVFARRAG